MYTPGAKRQRLDSANEALRKPFKSPAVRRDPAATEDGTTSPRPNATNTGSPSVQCSGSATTRQIETHLTPARQRQRQQQFSTPARHRPFSLSRPQRQQQQQQQDDVSPSTVADTKTVGIRSAREVEGRREIIRQAERIRGRASEAETDGKLDGLIGKWRVASRLAAEEVFEASRDRVRAMGGMKKWRKMRSEEQKSFAARMMEEEERPGRDRDGNGDDEDRAEKDESEENGEDDDDEDDEEDEQFTMGTMLRSMNIDFDLIGYDESTGWWRDG